MSDTIEEPIEVAVVMPKRAYDFLIEFAHWAGYDTPPKEDYFMSEVIEEALRCYIERILADMMQTNELHDKVRYFEEKYCYKAV